MLKTMQPASAIIAGLNSDATAMVRVACRALWIKKAIIAKYEAIIASANWNRRAPNLLTGMRDGTTSVVLCKLVPHIGLSASLICDRACSG
jgi:hypothetical protein